MKIRVLFLLLVAPLFLNSCALLLGTGGSSGSVESEITLTSVHSGEKKNAIKLVCLSSLYNEEFIRIYFMNKTNGRFFIEWENARCDGGKIVFGDDRRISMNNAKADEAVSAYSASLTRNVTSLDYIGSDYILPLFRTKRLKEGLDDVVRLKIPVRFSDGSVEEYSFNVRLFWESTK